MKTSPTELVGLKLSLSSQIGRVRRWFRHTIEGLKMAWAEGLMDGCIDVIDIGMTGTEEIYLATFYLGVDDGIEVTASHHPLDYNGMKLVKKGARRISGDTGLHDIQRLAEANQFIVGEHKGSLNKQDISPDFVTHLMTYVAIQKVKPLKFVVNAGNGAAGHVIGAIEAYF